MAGIPVTVVPSGGLAVTEALNGYGMPVSVVTAYGLAVTAVASGGLPVTGLDTGSSVGPAYRMIARPGSFVLSGESMEIMAGYVVQAGVGAFALAGQSATLTYNTGVAAYTGPGEITGWDTAYGYWGLRAYNASKIGANCIDVCSNQYDTPVGLVTMIIGADGYLSLSNKPAYDPIYIAKLYDQVGSRDLSYIFGIDNRPVLVLNKVGGKPAMFFNGGEGLHSAAVATAQPQPVTMAAVAVTGSQGQIVTDGSFGYQAAGFGAAGTKVGQAFGVYAYQHNAPGLGVVASYISVALSTPSANGASSTMSVNATRTTVDGGVGPNGIGSTNKFSIGCTDSNGGALTNGYIYEVIIKAGAVSPANQDLLTANQRGIGTGF
jgi:hypothetical protein